jgi:hypothetical protein
MFVHVAAAICARLPASVLIAMRDRDLYIDNERTNLLLFGGNRMLLNPHLSLAYSVLCKV